MTAHGDTLQCLGAVGHDRLPGNLGSPRGFPHRRINYPSEVRLAADCLACPCFKRAGSNSSRRSSRRKSRLWGDPRQSLDARSLVFEKMCSRHSHLYGFHGRATFAVGDVQLGVPRKEQPWSTLHGAWVGPTQTERVPPQLRLSMSLNSPTQPP